MMILLLKNDDCDADGFTNAQQDKINKQVTPTPHEFM